MYDYEFKKKSFLEIYSKKFFFAQTLINTIIFDLKSG